MSVENLLKNHHSVRAFLDKSLPETKTTIHKILDAARFAPAGAIAEPWEVVVLSGQPQLRLSNALMQGFETFESASSLPLLSRPVAVSLS